jgi:Leucine-rich repeat (LRR) protein
LLPYTYDPVQKKCAVPNAVVFPSEIFEIANKIEILDMSGGQLSSLPDTFGDLTHLRIAFFAHNNFTEIPRVLASCPALEMVGFKSCKISTFGDNCLPENIRGLILTGNDLTTLPASIGNYSHLQKIMLAGNKLRALPHELLACQELELLRLAVNDLTEAPDWLFELPKLAWYSDASNGFSDTKDQPALPEYSWQSSCLAAPS